MARDDLEFYVVFVAIPIICIVGFIIALINSYQISLIEVNSDNSIKQNKDKFEENNDKLEIETQQKIFHIYSLIRNGSEQFLWSEYKYLVIFLLFFGCVIVGVIGLTTNEWDLASFSLICFFLGASGSICSGIVGMKIATYSNARTTIMARKSLSDAFNVAIKGGYVMGFFLTSLIIIVLWGLFHILSLYYEEKIINLNDEKAYKKWQSLFKAITGFGVGASSVALFARVGGGIYTKAADVGADLVGKNESDLPEDDPRNPAVIADNVGDNVGDIAGMGADLYGSLAGSTCASMVLTSEIRDIYKENNQILLLPVMLPLIIYATGLVSSIIASVFGNCFITVKNKNLIKKALSLQEILATIISMLLLLITIPICFSTFKYKKCTFRDWEVTWLKAYICCILGLSGGLLIGFVTEYYTSYNHKPVQEVSESCRTGTATNVIYGLALGYKSTVYPAFIIALITIITNNLAGVYGISLATLGVLTTISTSLAIDAYGPICDNAGGIAEMSGLKKEVRDRTDALDAAGNTTAAIGKGFAIASAALVAIALLGAFSRIVASNEDNRAFDNYILGMNELKRKKYEKFQNFGANTKLLHPTVLAGLIIGGMLPYYFSALTMKSVGTAASEMVKHVRKQFKDHPGILKGLEKPNYSSCIEISTIASLKEMIAPGALVILTPLFFGFFLGTQILMGILAGSIFSGVHMATSSSNTGGAWDNAKKYIEAGNLIGVEKGSDTHKASVEGDTIGDPLKDTSGPALNILIKLMGIISVLFATSMCKIEERILDGNIYYNHPNGLFGKFFSY